VTKRVFGVLLALIAAFGIALAATYTVQPGDTLSSIARTLNVSVDQLRSLNSLTTDALEPGQVLKLPANAGAPTSQTRASGFITTSSKTSKLRVTHRASCIPGDPVLVRVTGASEQPQIAWGNEFLVPAQDGQDWVAVGREILGTKPKTVSIVVTVGQETLPSSLKLIPDPQRVINVFMSQQVLSTLSDQNRMRERTMLDAAYSKSMQTAKAWTKAFAPPLTVASSVSPFAQARFYKKGDIVNYHYGEDFVGREGTPIKAVNDGVVTIAGTYPIRGGLVGINHGAGITSLYFHQSAILVKVGQAVKRGDVIGRVGATGFATGPHLHLEMRVNGEATDPKQWVNRVWPK
jgi:murein DD-endopeptidase MepM/ murein hydrolase activator NlpD